MTHYTTLEQCKRVDLFNRVVGNIPREDKAEWFKQVANQAAFLLEEVKETLAAAEDLDAVELLDGVADVFYVANYLLTLLRAQGFDVDDAYGRVCDNNSEKYTTSLEEAKATQQHHIDNGVKCYVESSMIRGMFYHTVRRSEDDKVLKPKTFGKVDLIDCVPSNFL